MKILRKIEELSHFHGNKLVSMARDTMGKHKFAHPNEFSKEMEAQGIHHETLGSGLFGATYQHPTKPDQVIKLFKNDSAYEHFAKHARDNHHKDPHLPVIHAVHKIGKNIGYVRMEKLENYKHEEMMDHPLNSGRIGGYLKHHLPDAKPKDKFDTESHVGIVGAKRDIEAVRKYRPSVHATIQDIAKHLAPKSDTMSFDLHHGNVMHRKDGTPVITDPVIDHKVFAKSPEPTIKARSRYSQPKKRNPFSGAQGTMAEEIGNAVGGGNIAGIGVGPKGEPGVSGPMVRRKKFAGHTVFEVTSDTFHKARVSKANWKHWKSYIGEDDTGMAIREYANKNPKSSIVLQDERTGAMSFARYGSK